VQLFQEALRATGTRGRVCASGVNRWPPRSTRRPPCNPGAAIGRHVVLNTNCSVDHDCQIGDFASVSPGAALGGNVKLGYCSFVGIGAAVNQGISISDHTVVGAGAVVIRDLCDRMVAVGVPAREIRSREPNERHL
jgi:acetyltransferase-like isoleucine patch superfamily enzyme